MQALVLMSGGIDSTACAHWLLGRSHQVQGVFIDYGQLARRAEERAATAVAAHLSIPLSVCRLQGYEQSVPGELFGRNAFLIFGAVFARSFHEGLICFGAHAGTPYFDCSPPFVQGLDRVLSEMSDGRLRLVAPFLDWRKAEVAAYFMSAALPLELTYSCEAGGDEPCGACPSCRDRIALGMR